MEALLKMTRMTPEGFEHPQPSDLESRWATAALESPAEVIAFYFLSLRTFLYV